MSPNGFGNPSVGTCTDPGKFLAKALNDPNEPAGLTTDDVALIWLGNQSRVMEVRATSVSPRTLILADVMSLTFTSKAPTPVSVPTPVYAG